MEELIFVLKNSISNITTFRILADSEQVTQIVYDISGNNPVEIILRKDQAIHLANAILKKYKV